MNNLSIIILSFNTLEITKIAIQKAIESARICQKKLGNKIEIIVVDNASGDGSSEMIKRKYPQVILRTLLKNMGTCVGNNEGMKIAKYPYILLINSDTYLFPGTLFNSVHWMDKHKYADVMIGKLYRGNNKQYFDYGGSLPTPFKTVRWLLGLESLPLPMDRIYQKRKELFKKERELGWIPTCFLFMRRNVFEKTGGHDENMFFYMEDVEFCKQIKDAGFSIYYTPQVSAVHLGGKSTVDKLKMKVLLQRQVDGLLYYQKKHHFKTLSLVKLFLFFGFKMRVFAYAFLRKFEMAYTYAGIKF